jgi:hypothetical protein
MLVHLAIFRVTRHESALKRQLRIPANVSTHYYKMKQSILFLIIFLIISSSCSLRQNYYEKKVFNQLGDSCVYKISNLIEHALKKYSCIPPPTDFLIGMLNGKYGNEFSLNKYDTLGYPCRFSVYEFKSKVDTLNVKEYYKEYYYENDIRIRYIYENILIYDTIETPTLNMLHELTDVQDNISNNLQYDKIDILYKRYFPNKTLELTWDSLEIIKYSKIINDLKPTRIKFYRIIFDKDYTKGILFVNYEIWGLLKSSAYFEIEKNNSTWSIKGFKSYNGERNPKRWRIE